MPRKVLIGGGLAALSLLSDYFPPRMRATSQSIYSSGISIGGGLAFFLGGWIGQTSSPRSSSRCARPCGGARTFRAKRRIGAASRRCSISFGGYALVSLASNNLGIWVPTYFVREHGFKLTTVGTFADLMAIAVGMPAMILGGWLSDRVKRRMAFTATAAFLSAPLWLGLLNVRSRAAHHRQRHAVRAFDPLGRPGHRWGGLRSALLVCPAACAAGALFLWLGSRRARPAESVTATARRAPA